VDIRKKIKMVEIALNNKSTNPQDNIESLKPFFEKSMETLKGLELKQ